MTVCRSRSIRPLAGVSLLVALAGGLLHATADGGLTRVVADLRSYRHNQTALADSHDSIVTIDERFRLSQQRTQLRKALHEQLLDGTISLRDACEAYREVVNGDEAFDRLMAATVPGGCGEERLANFLLRSLFSTDAPGLAGRREPLAEEFREWFGHEAEIDRPAAPRAHPVRAVGRAPLLRAE